MDDGRHLKPVARRAAGRVLRPLRDTAGRFVRPAIDARAAGLEERLEALAREASAASALNAEALGRELAAGTTRLLDLEVGIDALALEVSTSASRNATLEERIEALAREVREGTARAAALEERIEAIRVSARSEVSGAVDTLRTRLAEDRRSLRHELMTQIERTRSRLAVPDSDVIALEEFRSSPDYARIYEDPEPLVSVTVATFNRAELLIERCLRSILDQDYTNLEIVVVGDGCTDDTEARVGAVGDDRIRYVNLVDRVVPAWVGRGSDALNLARSLATGDLLTHLDDDDEYMPDRIGRLVRYLQESRAELVWHPFWWQEASDAEWSVNDAEAPEFAKVTSGSLLYLGWFSRVPWDPLTARYGSPGDWTLFRTLRDMGVRARRYPVPLLRHYLERQNPRLREGPGSDQPLVRTTASALRREMSLIPEMATLAEHDAQSGQVSPWLRAVVEISDRVGIPTNTPIRAVTGTTFPTLVTDKGHVLRLYGPWHDGAAAFRQDVGALQKVGRVAGRPVPKLLAHGELKSDWTYTVTTEVPGIRLSSVRDELSRSDLENVVGWLAGVVRELHATPLSDEERAQGEQAFSALMSERRASLGQTVAEQDTLPAHLRSQLEGWLPPLEDLLPGREEAVMLHGQLEDANVLGVWHGGRFDPTGVIGLRQARIGHPWAELGPFCRGVARWDLRLTRSFLRDVGWAGVDDPGFARLALAFVLLGDSEPVIGLPAIEEAHDLDDLAARLFGPSL